MSIMQPYSVDNRILLITAAALIDPDNRVLVQLRPDGKPLAGLWEFPGGKVEAGETPATALVRELFEELSVQVEEKALIPFTFASEPLGDRDLILLLYVCRHWSGNPVPNIASDLKWCSVSELEELAMPPADVPLVDQLRRIL